MAKNIDFDGLFTEAAAKPEKKVAASPKIDFDSMFGGEVAAPAPAAAPERTIKNVAGDTLNALMQGGVSAAEGVVGLGNLVSGGRAGKLVESAGIDLKNSHKYWDDLLQSDAQKAANAKVDAAEGVVGTVKAAIENPSVIARMGGESLPSMAVGGGLGKLAATAFPKLAAIAGAVGEGAISAGSTAESVRQETEDGLLTGKQAAVSAGSGFLVGVLGAGGSRLSSKLGIADVDDFVAGMAKATPDVKKGMARRVIEGAVAEGLIEEMPQSAVEQIAQNVATDKPWSEGVDKAAALGGLTGGAMGGGMNIAGRKAAAPEPAPAAPQPAAEQAPAPAATGPSKSQQFAQVAFAEIGGDEGAIEARKAEQGAIALSLQQIAANDGEAGLVQAIEHLSAGDADVAEKLYEASQDKALIAAGRAGLAENSIGFIEANEMIRLDAGLIEGEAVPAADTPVQQTTTKAPTPEGQTQAQVNAVRSGRKLGAALTMEEAQTTDMNGLAQAIATGPDGRQSLFVARDDAAVQQAVARAAEAGIDVAAGELLGMVEPMDSNLPTGPRAIVQHVDEVTGQVIHEEAVSASRVNEVKPTPGTKTVIRTVGEIQAERTQVQAVEQQKAEAQSAGPTFFKRAPKQRAPEKFTEATQTGAAKRLVDGINSSLGLTGDAAVSPGSLLEVTPSKNLRRMQDAVGTAFGVKLVYVHAPKGLVRNNGEVFNSFAGVADRSNKTVFMNIEADVPLNVLGHELAHILETEQPAIYEKLEAVVLSRMRLRAAKALQTRLAAAMKAEGSNAAAAEFRKEVVAEGIGEMAEDVQLWRDVFGDIGQDQTLAKTFYKAVMDVIAKLQRALTSAGYITGIRDVAIVKKAVVAAYKDWATEYEFKGENLANMTPEAQEMLSQFQGLRATDASVEAAAKRKAAKAEEAAAEKAETRKGTSKAVLDILKGAQEAPKPAQAPTPAPTVAPGRLEAVAAPQDDQEASMEGEGGISFKREEAKPYKDRPIPAELGKMASLENSFDVASKGSFSTNRQLKLVMQNALLAAAKSAKVDLSQVTPEVEAHLVKLGVTDALFALKSNENAVGWYDKTVTKALDIIAAVHPEIKTDVNAKFAFTYALAVTSNGIKVDKNFELADLAYNEYKKTGVMPSNIQAGQAQKAINASLDLFNTLSKQFGIDNFREMMLQEFTVKELQEISGVKVGGEFLGTKVRGAAILGPKIGNGFFSNLNGLFDQLTMDRWLMRTWGRWTGTLVEIDQDAIKKKRSQLEVLLRLTDADTKKAFEKAAGVKLRFGTLDAVAQGIQDASVMPATREAMNAIGPVTPEMEPVLLEAFGPVKKGQTRDTLGAELRKTGNALAKYLDGQKEAPAGPGERGFIRTVFGKVLAELQSQGYAQLTMSDLQALVWYPERRLYDAAKSSDDFSQGYSDDEAPDYANAAEKLAKAKGVNTKEINDEGTTRDSTGPAERTAGEEADTGQPAEAGATAEEATAAAAAEEVAPPSISFARVGRFPTDLDRRLMGDVPLMQAANRMEFQQRLQWLSEGMLRNNIEGVSNYKIDRTEIEQYQKYKAERDGTSVSFARNPLKMESVQDALDFTATGDLKLDLGAAIDRSAWADAYVAAKNPAERKTLLSSIGDGLIERFADSKIKVSRWIQSIPLGATLVQRLEGDLRRSDTVRSTLEQDVKDRFTEPMMKAITKASRASKLSSDQVKKMAGYWMAATYAPEASAQLIIKDRTELLLAQAKGDPAMIAAAQQNLNDRILDVNGAIGQVKVRGVGGGMNNAEAAQMVQNIEAKIDKAMLADIAKHVYAMMDWKKARDLATGKVTQAAVNSWLNSPRYVPLTGDPRFDRESTDVFSASGQLNQDADKEMNGRKDSVADDGIDAAFTAVIKSINFAAMQDFKRTLNKTYETAKAAGANIGITREPITGIMRTGDDIITYRDAATRANGSQYTESYAFRFQDKAIMEALKKDNQEQLNSMLKVIATPTRWYGRLVTQFMPMFAPINLVRDIWERSELIRTRKLYDASGNLIDVDKAARASIADVINHEVWKASMMKAFKKGGMNPVRGDLEEMIRLGGSSTTGDYLNRSAGDLEADIRGDASRLGHARNVVMQKVEAWNDTFEMIPSLSIYRALKAQGMAPKDAAAAVLDLMNFRKKGTLMPAVKALYVFAQPAATGGYNLAQYLNTRKGKVRFAAQVALGSMLYAMLKNVWGDDDDEEIGNKLDNLSNFTVERTIPIKLGEYVIKLPVGFGPPQLAWQTAVTINRWESGRYNTTDALGELAKGWAKNFAAISPSDMELSKRPVDFLAQTFTPTVLKPLYNIASDQTSFGSPLTPSFKNPDKLKSEQALRTTPPFYRDVAEAMHEMTGVDMYPDHIKALVNGYMIGPINQIVSMTIDAEAKKMRGEPERVPLVAQIIDSVNDRQMLNSVYNRVRNEMDKEHREFASMQADPEKRGEITPDMVRMERAYQKFQATEKVIGVQRGAVAKMTNLDADAKSDRVQAIEERADTARRKLLVEYFGNQ